MVVENADHIVQFTWVNHSLRYLKRRTHLSEITYFGFEQSVIGERLVVGSRENLDKGHSEAT